MVTGSYYVLGFVGLEFQNIGDWMLFFFWQFNNGGVSVGGFDLMMVLFWLEQDEDKCVLFYVFDWKNMGMVDNMVNSVDVKKIELEEQVWGEEKSVWEREEVTIDREEWVRLKKKGKGPVWSINRSCASHMITNGENRQEIWQKDQMHLVKGRESWCIFLKCKG